MPPGVSRPLDNLQAASILSLPRRNAGGSAFQAPSAGAAAKALTSEIEKKLLRFKLKDKVPRNDRASIIAYSTWLQAANQIVARCHIYHLSFM